jgi:hypothetical protein
VKEAFTLACTFFKLGGAQKVNDKPPVEQVEEWFFNNPGKFVCVLLTGGDQATHAIHIDSIARLIWDTSERRALTLNLKSIEYLCSSLNGFYGFAHLWKMTVPAEKVSKKNAKKKAKKL